MAKEQNRTAPRAARKTEGSGDRAETVEVIATENGFYGDGRIRAGTTFYVPEGYTGSWFERADGKPMPKKNNHAREQAAAAGLGVLISAEEYAEFERLKANPRENDNLNAAGEKIGEKADAVEDAAKTV